jgi:trans-2,3-dihydro-3-hydroxyanthranilate isomerase
VRLVSSAPLAWLYASFADGFGGGNPAGVVVSPEPLGPASAQAIASVLSVPTTGFAVEPEAGAESTVDVRFFTPDREIDACGHVTIAVAAALVELGVWQWGGDVTVRARGGEFPLKLRDGCIEMTQQLRLLEPAPVRWPEVEAALGRVRPQTSLPLALVGTGLRHLVVPVPDMARLAALELDAGRVAALAQAAAADTICVWAPTVGSSRVRVRDLCAAIGALEEPASGTTAAALALYLADTGQLAGSELIVEQGIEMGRPSRIEVAVDAADTATVRGAARKLLSGQLEPWRDDGGR